MEKYYVCGCIEIEGTVGRVEDEDAEFWSLYERDDSGLSQAIADFTDRRSAESVMTAYCDHAAEVARLKNENLIAEQCMREAGAAFLIANERFNAQVAEIDALREQVRVLAAENASHVECARKAEEVIMRSVFDYWEDRCVLLSTVQSITSSESSDAILREVGALAVEEFSAWFDNKYDWIDSKTGEEARDYAARICAGEVQP